MRNSLFIFSLVLIVIFNSYGQNNSPNLVQCKSKCTRGQVDIIKRRGSRLLLYEAISEDTILVVVETVAGCGVKYQGKITIERDIMNLSFFQDRTPHNGIIPPPPAKCDCVYEIYYYIKNLKNENLEVRLKGETLKRFYEPSSTTEELNINQIDKYGQRQGFFRLTGENIAVEEYYQNDIMLFRKVIDYYENGNKRRESIYGGKLTIKTVTEYYENGKRKKFCIGRNYINDDCKEWDENGLLIDK